MNESLDPETQAFLHAIITSCSFVSFCYAGEEEKENQDDEAVYSSTFLGVSGSFPPDLRSSMTHWSRQSLVFDRICLVLF